MYDIIPDAKFLILSKTSAAAIYHDILFIVINVSLYPDYSLHSVGIHTALLYGNKLKRYGRHVTKGKKKVMCITSCQMPVIAYICASGRKGTLDVLKA